MQKAQGRVKIDLNRVPSPRGLWIVYCVFLLCLLCLRLLAGAKVLGIVGLEMSSYIIQSIRFYLGANGCREFVHKKLLTFGPERFYQKAKTALRVGGFLTADERDRRGWRTVRANTGQDHKLGAARRGRRRPTVAKIALLEGVEDAHQFFRSEIPDGREARSFIELRQDRFHLFRETTVAGGVGHSWSYTQNIF